ncbi:MAG: hypothetical protein WAW60_04425 [Candidatus Saccharimonadales bacterium]|jgi:uncharacterized protein YdeI (YjbR/CyaY-like superfamily)
MRPELPTLEFTHREDLHTWLEQNHSSSPGIFVRVYKKVTGVPSISFEDLLEEGLCFGWSESLRLKGDEKSYLQKFTPRRTRGTTSDRNLRYTQRLIKEGRMKPEGLRALGLSDVTQLKNLPD